MRGAFPDSPPGLANGGRRPCTENRSSLPEWSFPRCPDVPICATASCIAAGSTTTPNAVCRSSMKSGASIRFPRSGSGLLAGTSMRTPRRLSSPPRKTPSRSTEHCRRSRQARMRVCLSLPRHHSPLPRHRGTAMSCRTRSGNRPPRHGRGHPVRSGLPSRACRLTRQVRSPRLPGPVFKRFSKPARLRCCRQTNREKSGSEQGQSRAPRHRHEGRSCFAIETRFSGPFRDC